MSVPSIYDTPDPLPDGPDYADAAIATLAEVELVAEDGEPMESAWHRDGMNLLIGQVDYHLRDRSDYYVGGNMFVYFDLDRAKNRDFRGPDFFFVKGARREPGREYWAVWLEGGRPPNVIIELSSPTTRDVDHGEKFEVYRDRLRVAEYFIYDPAAAELVGWRHDGEDYRPLRPRPDGRLSSNVLGLTLGPWDGTYARDTRAWLRFFDSAGEVIPIREEAAERRAAEETRRADTQTQRAEAEKQRADSAEKAAAAERARADALAAELAKLREQFAPAAPAPEAKP